MDSELNVQLYNEFGIDIVTPNYSVPPVPSPSLMPPHVDNHHGNDMVKLEN